MEFFGDDRREGLGRRAHSRFVLLLLLMVCGLLLLSSLYSAQASVFKKAREGVLDATSPVLELFARPIGAVNDAIGYVGDYFAVLEENKALRRENAELRQWMYEALDLREIVAAYDGLQSYAAAPEIQPIDAYVIGEANDAYARSMIVNAGRKRNVESGQAVVDENGLVGRIVDAGRNASRVLLLSDIQSRVPVYVEGADVEGMLVGSTRAKPSISIINTVGVVETAPGQRILTSGAGGTMPRGIPVGIVDRVRGEEILIDLYANYARTRMVRIINYEFPAFVPAAADATESENPAPSPSESEGAPAEG